MQKIKKQFTEEESKNITTEEIYFLMNDKNNGGMEFKDGKLTIFEKYVPTKEQAEYIAWYENAYGEHCKKIREEINQEGPFYIYKNISKEEYINKCMTMPGCVSNFKQACGLIADWAFKQHEEYAGKQVLRKFVWDLINGKIKDISNEAKEALVKSDAAPHAYSSIRAHIVVQYPDTLFEEVLQREEKTGT